MAKQQNSLSVDVGLLLIRIMPAVVFIAHGAQKLFGAWGGPGMEGFTGYLGTLGIPMPAANAYLAAGAEFFGGIALLIGLATRLVSVPLVVTMLVASFGVHGSEFFASAKGLEYSLTLAMVTAGFIFTGAGRFSVDALFRRDKLEPVQV